MDAPRFARNVEAQYRGMWQRWCARPRPVSPPLALGRGRGKLFGECAQQGGHPERITVIPSALLSSRAYYCHSEHITVILEHITVILSTLL